MCLCIWKKGNRKGQGVHILQCICFIFPKTPVFLSVFLSQIFLSVQCSGAISPDVLVELLVIKEYMEWKG